MNYPKYEAIEICKRFNVQVEFPFPQEKVGIALVTLHLLPLNAVRHKAENGTCGWYIWGGGTLHQDPDFFQPIHVSHLDEYVPGIQKYLALPAGWRVLLAPNYEDVWFDESLLAP
ncbi:immunity protein Imm33 domain-containing protein [Vogesella indigofera]|uniref:immunity protein Imm33 domain-containing protein n=1 Tax=Vogesella indigofera TaxID=45465 RepID=UPI00234F9483|nr:hypothetical protein [Vogesella indigofera]MDC7700566.1 hypothetical protein [Vogesella indigofera]